MSGAVNKAGTGSADQMYGSRLDRIWEYMAFVGPLTMIIILSLIMLWQAPHYFRWPNMRTILVDASLYMVLAVGMTYVITARGIDLSIGSIMVLSSVVMAAAIKDFQMSTLLAMSLGLLVGALCGLLNGLVITQFRIPDFVVTLAGDLAFRGIALVYAAGAVFYRFDEAIVWLGRGRILDIPVPIYLGIIAIILGQITYKHTAFGRHVHAVGGNIGAARRLGLPVKRIRIYVYVLAGLLAGVAGIIMTGRLDAVQATQAQGAALHTIAAVIIGGTSLFGGRGSMIGAALGAILLSMITNSMVLLGFSFFWQQVAAAVVIVVAVALYTLRESSAE
jgi:ribose transport system permease protein